MLLGVILEYIACQLLPEEDQDPAKVTYRYRLNDSLSSLSLGILNQVSKPPRREKTSSHLGVLFTMDT